MIENRRRTRFPQESLAQLRGEHRLRARDLERDLPAQLRVIGLKDDAVTAAAQLPADAKAADRRRGVVRSGRKGGTGVSQGRCVDALGESFLGPGPVEQAQ